MFVRVTDTLDLTKSEFNEATMNDNIILNETYMMEQSKPVIPIVLKRRFKLPWKVPFGLSPKASIEEKYENIRKGFEHLFLVS